MAALCPGPHTCVYRGPAALVAWPLLPTRLNFLGKYQGGEGEAGVDPKKQMYPWKHSSKPSGSSPYLEQVRDNTEFSFQLGIDQRNWKQTTDLIKSLSDFQSQIQRPTQTQLQAMNPKE